MIKPFKDLKRASKMALVQYMIVDGDAWKKAIPPDDDYPSDMSIEEIRKELMPGVIEHYGHELFVETTISISLLKAWIMENHLDLKKDFKTFDEYHAWYLTIGHTPNHGTSRWPCILDQGNRRTYDCEVFQDGWHRFHSYVKKGYRKIPCVGYTKRGKDISILPSKGIVEVTA